jgi:hypothetical protein
MNLAGQREAHRMTGHVDVGENHSRHNWRSVERTRLREMKQTVPGITGPLTPGTGP